MPKGKGKERIAAMAFLFSRLWVWVESLTTIEIVVSAGRIGISVRSVSDDKIVSQIIMVSHLLKETSFALAMMQFTDRNIMGRKNFISGFKNTISLRFDFKKKEYFCTY